MTKPATSKTSLRTAFLTGRAPSIVSAVRPGATPWSGTMPLSKRFAWFDDGDQLVLVGCPGEKQHDVDLGLAYGLAHAGDRALTLVLPAGTEEPTRRRLPWFDVPVTVCTWHDNGTVTEQPPLTRHEVLAALDDPLVTAVHQLGERSHWIERLTQWADACPELVSAHRPSYLSWHCRGRMVLRAKTTSAGGLTVSAGVHSTATPDSRHEEPLSGRLSPEQFHRLVSAASTAIADRLGGLDDANAEHALQERLTAMRSSLGLSATLREFPAMRPVGRRGYIDLLGVASDGALHVVETKIGSDPMLVLQGLDYWTWAMAHRAPLAEHLNTELGTSLSAKPGLVLDFVVAAKNDEIVSPYTAAQLEALDGSINWQVHRFDGWDRAEASISSFGRRRVPEASRAAAPRFAVRLETDLVARAGDALHRRVFFRETGAGITNAAKPDFEALRTRGLLHGYVNHVRSSQAFAFNLFAGLKEETYRDLWQLIDPSVTIVDGIEFEYVDAHDALGELQSTRPHQTQVDVLLRGRTTDGVRHVALIEVKLSETQFGSCSGFDADTNDTLDTCRQPGPWGGDPTACFQLRNYNGPTRRRYDQHLQASQIATNGTTGCVFRALNQPMRNVALALGLIDRDEADKATFALCAPTANTNVWRQWRTAQRIFAPVPDVTLMDLPAEAVVAALDPPRRHEIEKRYGFTEEVG